MEEFAGVTSETVTFKDAATRFLDAHLDTWKNPKHRQQWESTLRNYAFPVFGDVPVAEVDKALVLRVIEPIWKTKTETANRVRSRIERVLDWARARDLRTGGDSNFEYHVIYRGLSAQNSIVDWFAEECLALDASGF